MIRKGYFAAVAALVLAGSANAAVIVGVLPNPSTTAGVAASTRSGAGTWHLYAVETGDSTDLGISSYNITLAGATAINHRSSNGSANNSDGDSQTWGFTGLRSGTNANPIVASQALPGTSLFLVQGFGKTAGNANTVLPTIDAGVTGITAVSGISWGNYATEGAAVSNMAQVSAANGGNKWMFIAEGTGAITPTSVTAAVFTVYSNAQGTSISTPLSGVVDLSPGVIPEPATVTLIGLAMAGFGFIRRRS